MSRLKQFIYKEFFGEAAWMRTGLLLFGLCLQGVVFYVAPSSPVAMCSAVAGVFSVVLCSEGKISNFLFGFLQVTTYLYICYIQHLYGEVLINVFYFLSMVYGVFSWRKQYRVNDDAPQVLQTRRLTWRQLLLVALSASALSALVGWLLSRYTDDPQPYLDAFTTVPAIYAQILMVLRYRDQWYIWLLIDVLAAWMWLRVADYAMMTLYIFWCFVCLNGYFNWTKELAPEAQNE